MPNGTLYLIPSLLGATPVTDSLPSYVIAIIQQLDVFVVENEKTARAFLRSVLANKPLQSIHILCLEPTLSSAQRGLDFLQRGMHVGLMSDAGCPAIADPGANLVALAHQHAISVQPLVGPSAILLSLMASGLNGQRFTFLGYLPKAAEARRQKLKSLSAVARHSTQIMIETPYRNLHLLRDMLDCCEASLHLCVACNLTLGHAYIRTLSIAQWREQALPNIHKQPTMFLLGMPI